MLANSITLTPGTITVELTGNKLKVLWINKTTDDPEEIRKAVSYDIEERLRKI
jgi:multicomponent Na+:H+ antiporter subunit E